MVHYINRWLFVLVTGWAVQKEEGRLRRVVMWVILVLTLTVAVLTAIAQLGEAILRVVKAWRPIMF